MTTPTNASTQSASTSGSQAARQTSGHGAATRANQRSPADLFANLLGLLSASSDEPALPGSSPLSSDAAGSEADTDALLLDDPQAALLAQTEPANPLADLIGWPGAAGLSTGSDVASTQGKKDNAKGTPIEGMTLVDQPVEADADLANRLKAPSAASAPAAAAADLAAPDKDAVSVTYGDSPAPTEGGADTGKADRNNPATMAARPANWRSTTTLAPGSAASLSTPSGTSTPHNHTATLQANAVQQAQNAAVQRGPMADPMQAASRPISTGGERFSDASTAQTAAAELIAAGPSGHSTKGDAGGSGGERDAAVLTGTTAASAADPEATEEAFSLDAALASEEELDGQAFLSPNQLRHANVRVGQGTDEAIDIRLSLEGDAVNVDFRTDNAEVRAGLQSNAGETLSDLMQRGGVQLGGVSVGAQSQQPGGQPGSPNGAPSRVGASNGRGAASVNAPHTPGDELRPRNPVARRSDGGPALDLFA